MAKYILKRLGYIIIVFFLLLLTVGVLLFESMSLEAGGLGLLCGGLCGGAAAGLMGSKPKKKRRKK